MVSSNKAFDERPVRVVVIDDHLVVREGLRMMLEIAGEGGFELVGSAEDGASGLRLLEEIQPDVVLMDLRMPGMDGLEAITHIRHRWPNLAVVILTTYNEDELMLSGLQAGARGYLLKDASRETLFNAIRTAARGEMVIQPETMARILAHTSLKSFQGISAKPSLSYASSADLTTPVSFQTPSNIELTERELEILLGVASGERSKEIAMRLNLSLRTVGAHLTNIYTKLNVDSRASAVAVALKLGLLR